MLIWKGEKTIRNLYELCINIGIEPQYLYNSDMIWIEKGIDRITLIPAGKISRYSTAKKHQQQREPKIIINNFTRNIYCELTVKFYHKIWGLIMSKNQAKISKAFNSPVKITEELSGKIYVDFPLKIPITVLKELQVNL